MKQCTKCGVQKPLFEFYKDAIRSDGLRGTCKICDIKKSRTYREQFPEKSKKQVRNSKLKIKYGIDLDQFEAMKSLQNNKCSICEIEFTDPKYTCVDHDHTTGAVRSILCGHCNTMLGLAKESTKTLNSAILYLDKHAKKEKL
jgi:hypothetical protein